MMLHANNRKAKSLWEFSLNQANFESACKAWQTIPHLFLKLRAKYSQKRLGYNQILNTCPEVDFRCVDTQTAKWSVTFPKTNLIFFKKTPHVCRIWHVSCTPFCHSLSGFRSWTCPVFQISSSISQLWKGKCNHHRNSPRSALLQTVQFGSKFLAVWKVMQSTGTAEQRNAEMWLREAGNPGEHQSKIFAFLCQLSLLLFQIQMAENNEGRV